MAVAEYKLNIVGHRGQATQPLWIRESGHFFNPADKTRIGWVVDNADYYVPESVVTLTKEELVQRQLTMHEANPERIYTGDFEGPEAQEEDTENWRDKTDAEVRAEVEAWYDDYVAQCQGIEK
jgi:hypothetical protein